MDPKKYNLIYKSFSYIVMGGLLFWSLNVHSQVDKKSKRTELSASYGMLIYQSVYSLKNSSGLELSLGRSITEQFKWEAGLRADLKSFQPEGFVRLLASQRFGKWNPCFACEFGLSNRTNMNSSGELLREARESMLDNIGYAYLSTHSEFLAFRFENHWNISFLEIDFGSHLRHFGRTLRVQLNLISLGRTF